MGYGRYAGCADSYRRARRLVMYRLSGQLPPMRLLTFLLIACLAGSLFAQTTQPATPPERRWEKQIERFEAQDRERPPAPGGVLFVGSSTIVHWNIADSFPDLPTSKRGFGGSKLSDSLYYADRIILPYQPRVIVLYAGENDLAGGV